MGRFAARSLWPFLLIVLVAAADLTLFASRRAPVVPAAHLPGDYLPEPIKEALGDERFIAPGTVLLPETAALYGLRDARGYDALSPRRYEELMRRIDPASAHAGILPLLSPENAAALREGRLGLSPFAASYLGELFRKGEKEWFERTRRRLAEASNQIRYVSAPARLLALAGVRRLVLPPGARLPFDALDAPDAIGGKGDRPWKKLYRGEVEIYENRLAPPRAFIAFSLRAARDGAEALEFLTAPGSGFPQEAVIEGRAISSPPGPNFEKSIGKANIVLDEAEKVIVTTNSDRPGLLVLLDNYFPGWRAELDARSAALLRADYAFRGVRLPAGKHRVVFRYRPPLFLLGLALSLAGAALAAALLLAARKGER